MSLSRYASLYFCVAIEPNDNELISLEIIHRYVELLDKYFGSVRILPVLDSVHVIELAPHIAIHCAIGGYTPCA